MTIKKRFLTKTLLMKGLQCPKQLYLYLNHKELADPQDDKTIRVMKEGNVIGELARTLYPNGLLISEKDPLIALERTKQESKTDVDSVKDLLKIEYSQTFFEAAYEFDDFYCRVDIIEIEQISKVFTLTEVKSSTDWKDCQIEDLAIQTYILMKNGYKVNKLFLSHINKDYTNDRPISEFFTNVDKTDEVLAILPEIERKILHLKVAIQSLPNVAIGPQCTKPYICSFKTHCFNESGVTEDSILKFPHLATKWTLFNSGITKISQLQESDLKTDNQKEHLKKIKNGYLNKENIKSEMNKWIFPIHFLDFETVDTIFPKYPKTRPNAKIPYQFSVYSLTTIESEPVLEKAYIADSLDTDPRYKLAQILVETLKTQGSIISYNASFEKSRIEEMATLFPDLRDELLKIKDRLIDLLEIVRDNVYLKDFNGSWSIKSVTPALFGKDQSYKEMKIQNGLAAQEVYFKALTENNLEDVRQNLEDYCNKDVLEMIHISKYLHEKANDLVLV